MFIKMDELDKVAEGVREPLDQPLINSIYMRHINILWTQVVLAELPMVELDEVAEGVREPLDHPVSRLDCFKSICH